MAIVTNSDLKGIQLPEECRWMGEAPEGTSLDCLANMTRCVEVIKKGKGLVFPYFVNLFELVDIFFEGCKLESGFKSTVLRLQNISPSTRAECKEIGELALEFLKEGYCQKEREKRLPSKFSEEEIETLKREAISHSKVFDKKQIEEDEEEEALIHFSNSEAMLLREAFDEIADLPQSSLIRRFYLFDLRDRIQKFFLSQDLSSLRQRYLSCSLRASLNRLIRKGRKEDLFISKEILENLERAGKFELLSPRLDLRTASLGALSEFLKGRVFRKAQINDILRNIKEEDLSLNSGVLLRIFLYHSEHVELRSAGLIERDLLYHEMLRITEEMLLKVEKKQAVKEEFGVLCGYFREFSGLLSHRNFFSRYLEYFITQMLLFFKPWGYQNNRREILINLQFLVGCLHFPYLFKGKKIELLYPIGLEFDEKAACFDDLSSDEKIRKTSAFCKQIKAFYSPLYGKICAHLNTIFNYLREITKFYGVYLPHHQIEDAASYRDIAPMAQAISACIAPSDSEGEWLDKWIEFLDQLGGKKDDSGNILLDESGITCTIEFLQQEAKRKFDILETSIQLCEKILDQLESRHGEEPKSPRKEIRNASIEEIFDRISLRMKRMPKGDVRHSLWEAFHRRRKERASMENLKSLLEEIHQMGKEVLT